MRRKLWLLIILFLSLVGRESCCGSQEQNQGQNQEQNQGQNQGINPAAGASQSGGETSVLEVCFTSLWYWYFDLHQKEKGWYTCKFFYASGYRTKLFYNRIYFDFYLSSPKMIIGLCSYGLLGLVGLLFLININVRIYRDFYIVLPIPVLPILFSVVIIIATLLIQ